MYEIRFKTYLFYPDGKTESDFTQIPLKDCKWYHVWFWKLWAFWGGHTVWMQRYTYDVTIVREVVKI